MLQPGPTSGYNNDSWYGEDVIWIRRILRPLSGHWVGLARSWKPRCLLQMFTRCEEAMKVMKLEKLFSKR